MSWKIKPGLVTVILSPLASTVNPFLTAVHVATDITISGTYATYSSVDAIDADSALTSGAKAALTAMLAPAGPLRPASVVAVKRTTSPAQTYVEALTAAFNAGLNALWITTDSRTAADIVAVSDYCEARDLIYLAQDGDSSWLDSGVPSGFSTIVDNKQTCMVYHPTDTEWADAEWAGAMSSRDPSTQPRVSGNCVIGNATSYDVTDTQAGFASANNINLIGLPAVASGNTRYLTGVDSATYHKYAVSLEGERLYAAVTKIWTKLRIEQELSALFAEYDGISQSIPANAAGESILVAPLTQIGEQGLAFGHFTRNTAVPEGYRFTVSITGTVATITAEYGFLDGIERVNVTAYLVRE